jgi:hypothetical protein
MSEEKKEIKMDAWKSFLKKHWKMASIVAAGLACAFIGAIAVFLWRTVGPEALTRYPATLGLWTVGNIVALVLDVLSWGLLLILLPVIAAVIVIYLLWWKKLPTEEQQAIIPSNDKGQRKKPMRGKGGGGFFNLLITITWLIVINSDGNWNTAFGAWTFTYLVMSVITAFLWDLLILGIPAAIVLIWWIRRELKNKQ